MNFELQIALRHLRAQKSKGLSLVAWLSIIGVGAGVAALVGGFSVTSGFNQAFSEKLLGVTAHLKVMRPQNPKRVIEQAEAMPGILAASPATHNQALITGAGGSVGSIVKGLQPARAKKTLAIDKHMIQGDLSLLRQRSSNQPATVVLGKELAKAIDAKLGDVVSILSPAQKGEQKQWGSVRGTPKMLALEVVGIFSSGYYEFDRLYAYIELAEAQRFFELGSRVDMVELRAQEPDDAAALGDSLRQKISLPFGRILDWRTSNTNLFVSLTMQRIAILIVLGVMVILAACNVASMLIMMVIERTRDIAILKAMGVRNGSIRKIFLLEGLLIALVGTIGGLSIAFLLFEAILAQGIQLDPTVYGIERLPILFNLSDYLFAAAGAMVITVVAALIPSLRAARLHPVDGLRELR